MNQEKDDTGKPKYTLVPVEAIQAIERVRDFGCKKYKDPDNWKHVEPDRYWEALIRHVIKAWHNWRKRDDESGLYHLEHILCNGAFLMAMIEDDEQPEKDKTTEDQD